MSSGSDSSPFAVPAAVPPATKALVDEGEWKVESVPWPPRRLEASECWWSDSVESESEVEPESSKASCCCCCFKTALCGPRLLRFEAGWLAEFGDGAVRGGLTVEEECCGVAPETMSILVCSVQEEESSEPTC